MNFARLRLTFLLFSKYTLAKALKLEPGSNALAKITNCINISNGYEQKIILSSHGIPTIYIMEKEDNKMTTMETNLSETGFKNRLKNLTVPYKIFDRGYENSDVFVLKAKNNAFRIGHHVKNVWNHDGYDAVFLYGKYFLDNTGKITVRFRFGKPLVFLIPFIFCLIFPFPIFLCLLYEALHYHELSLAPLLITGLFSILGFFGIFYSPKKTRQLLLQRLKRICNIE